MGDGKKDRYPSKNRVAFAFQAACMRMRMHMSKHGCMPVCSAQCAVCTCTCALVTPQEAHRINSKLQRDGAYNIPHAFIGVEAAITQAPAVACED